MQGGRVLSIVALQFTEKTKQMNARKLPIVLGMLLGAAMALAAGPAAAQAAGNSAGKPASGAPAGAAAAQAGNGKGDAKAAEGKIGMCIGCHAIPGYRASYPMVYSVPMIHGQTGKYIENALNAYRSGDRSHPTMRAIAGSLTDQDIADLAAYYGKSLENK
jgi:cytochrome c553